jgi:NAD+ diphosphatase
MSLPSDPVILPEAFEPAVTPPDQQGGPALWFIFQGTQLLVRLAQGSAVPAPCRDPAELGLPVLRSHYLGRQGEVACWAAEVAPDKAAPADLQWSGLRPLFNVLDDVLLSLAGRALQVIDWDRTHQYCGRCGTPTEARAGERARACPACAQVHYPRIAPAVMALVRRGDQLLLARSPHFAPGMHSALAGFVEAGESLEECLAREVREEVGISVCNPRYFHSQSWPFPHSLMVAFQCDWAAGDITPDPAEIESAGWFGVDELPVLPNRVSIARRLIEAALADIRAGR